MLRSTNAMPEDDRELTLIVTRGFAGIGEQLRERDREVTRLNENIIRIEGELKSMTATLNRMDSDLSKSESESLKVRVGSLEATIEKHEKKQDASDMWIRGLLVSVIFLLIGVVTNFVLARLK